MEKDLKNISTLTPLPDKPSELIRVALVDLEKCEKDPRYHAATLKYERQART